MDHLLPCPGCTRHVRALESVCPFCGEALPLSLRQRTPRLPARRLGRSATFAFGAALAASACSEAHGGGDGQDASVTVDGGSSSGEADAGAGEADAGAGEQDAAPAPIDAGPDSGGVAPAYGTPAPVDAGQADRDGGGGAVPLYGGPPVRVDSGMDTGRRDAGGGITPLYGGPPAAE